MRRLIATVLASLAVGLMLAAISLPDAMRATARQFNPVQATATQPVSPCVPEFNKVAAPDVVLLGNSTTITLTAKALCPAVPMHVVLVLPESSGVPAQQLQRIQDSAEQLVSELKLTANPSDQVGVVGYAGSGQTLCVLTNDERRVKACIRQLGSSGITAIDTGIDEGMKVLVRGRPHDGAADVREIMVVYAGSANAAGCDPVVSAASRVKSQKVLVMAVCAGNACDAACMRQVASSGRYYFNLDDGIVWPFQNFRIDSNLKRLTITDKLPPDMAYISDSADPAPNSIDPVRGFSWVFTYPPISGVTVTLRVQPMEIGERSTNVEATGELLDAINDTKRFTFPVPVIHVFAQPTETQTPTPTPTDTPFPHVTCTPPPCPCGILVGTCPSLRCEVCTATSTPPPGHTAYLPRADCNR